MITQRTFRQRASRSVEILFALLACLSASNNAAATLGKSEGEIAKISAALHMEQVETKTERGYSVTTLSSRGLVVKEFVDPVTKLVFGISWRGTLTPNLRILLGFELSELKPKQAYRSLHYSHFETPNLMLDMGGRMGFSQGRAIRLDLLPSGVPRSEVMP